MTMSAQTDSKNRRTANRACILSIGNELLSGLTVDTNAAWLAGRLADLGIDLLGVRLLPDDLDVIVRALTEAAEHADVILVTGGLGPTDDDLTRQAMARFLGVDLELRPDLLARIERFFAHRERPMAPTNRIQAHLPAGSEPLDNPVGTACGIRAEREGRAFFCLPGVPSEMKRMFNDTVEPELAQRVRTGPVIVRRRLRCFGAGESDIAALLGDRMQRGRNPLVNSTASNGIITLHIVAQAEDAGRAQVMIRAEEADLRNLLGELVFGDEEQTLAEVTGELLVRRGLRLAVAESCTGGLIGKLLTDVPGASRYFLGGWITYSNEAKIRDLGVPEALIGTHGAVSEPVAEAMARGARQRAQADLAVATTGIAGPEGGSEQKPVGLVYIAVAEADECRVRRFVWPHSRPAVRLRAALTAINELRLRLRN